MNNKGGLVKKTIKPILLLVMSLNLITACGQQFSPAEDPVVKAGTGNNNGGSGGGGTGGGTGNDELENLDLTGEVDGGTFDKIQTIHLDKDKGELILHFPLGFGLPFEITSSEVSDLPGVKVGTLIDDDGNGYLVLHLPLKYILRKVSLANEDTLPNGDPLPKMPSDGLPVVALSTKSSDHNRAYAYLGVEAMGIFIETSFNPKIGWSYPIKNKTKTAIVGYITSVPAKNNFKGGFFLSVRLPKQMAAILDKHFVP